MLPAYAGMIRRAKLGSSSATSAPRVCGDDPMIAGTKREQEMVLPAYAGMIPRRMDHLLLERGAPRVCGDDPVGPP